MLYELPFWKNELLFKSMLQNERIDPCLWICSPNRAMTTTEQQHIKLLCIEYAQKNNFPYIENMGLVELRHTFSPDYIFVVHPYDYLIPFNIKDIKNELVCFIPYGYSNLDTVATFNNLKSQFFHRFYVESPYIASVAKKYMLNKGKNIFISGLPFGELLASPSTGKRVWKGHDKKRLIWAPHWTAIKETTPILVTSTFCDIAKTMQELAEKYKDNIQIAFKPHPLLKHILYSKENWGKEKTDAYYQYWESNSYTQLEEGEYVELFKQSDAMIHDCGSFILEYLLVNKPCLYMQRADAKAQFNQSTLNALDCYQIGVNKYDIESFFLDILKGRDRKAKIRDEFINSYLIPKGTSPVKKIISDLLNP